MDAICICSDAKPEQSTRGIIFYPYGREDNTCAYVTLAQGTYSNTPHLGFGGLLIH